MHDFIIIKEVWCSRWGPIPFKSEEKKKAFSESAETNPVTVPPAAQPGELPWRLAVSSITSSFLYLFEAFSLQRKMMRARTRAKCCVRTSKAFLITYKFLPWNIHSKTHTNSKEASQALVTAWKWALRNYQTSTPWPIYCMYKHQSLISCIQILCAEFFN